MSLDDRFAELVLAGRPFTSDDVTCDGELALDADHEPNGAQSGIGAMFQRHAKAGHIEATGEVVRSRAPHRKGGIVRVWQPTRDGVGWARGELQLQLFD